MSLSPGVPASLRILTLQSNLLGKDDGPSVVYIRACYAHHLNKILDAFKTPNGSILLAGTRGLGKSLFGTLVVVELYDRGYTVVYEHMNNRLLLVGENMLAFVSTCMEKVGYQPLGEPGIYNLKGEETLFDLLVDQREIVFVQDLGDTPNATPIRSGNGRWLVVSSPNSTKLSYLRNQSRMKRLIVPLWSLQELQDTRNILKDLPVTRFAGYTPDEVKARFDIYGGVPRWVLDRPRSSNGYVQSSEEELNRALTSVSMSELEDVFRAGSYLDIPQQKFTGILVHVVPAGEEGGPLENDPPHCTFASSVIRQRMVDEFLSRQSFGASAFINAVRVIPELGGYRGYALEQNAHRTLPMAPIVSIRQLGKRAGSSELREVKLPRMTQVVQFKAENLDDLLTLQPLQYVRPESKIFPTLDAFAVLPSALFSPGTLGNCLTVFQVTVAATHDVDGSIISRVHTKVHRLLGLQDREVLPIVLVFLTDVNGIKTARTILKSDGTHYKTDFATSIKQFALYLGTDFNMLADFCRE